MLFKFLETPHILHRPRAAQQKISHDFRPASGCNGATGREAFFSLATTCNQHWNHGKILLASHWEAVLGTSESWFRTLEVFRFSREPSLGVDQATPGTESQYVPARNMAISTATNVLQMLWILHWAEQGKTSVAIACDCNFCLF